MGNNLSLLHVLSKTVVNNYPQYHTLSSKQQSRLIQKTYDLALKSALKKIELPPAKDAISRGIEREMYKRHAQKYRDKVKLPNYDLMEKLKKLILKRDVKNAITDTESNRGLHLHSSDVDHEFSSPSVVSSIKLGSDFSNYSNTSTSEKRSIFKVDIDKDIFDDKTKLKNFITRQKYHLSESLNEMYGVQEKLIVSKISQKTGYSVHVSKSIFQLYDLFNFLKFTEKLKQESRPNSKNDYTVELEYCKKVLFEYYVQWLKINGVSITNVSELENEIFQNKSFMSLNPENPLFEGFYILMSDSVDYSKVEEFLTMPLSKTPFVTKTKSKNTMSLSIIRKSKQKVLDYEYEIMKYLISETTLNQSDLQRTFLLHPVSVTDVLLHLEESGFITRKKMARDYLITVNESNVT